MQKRKYLLVIALIVVFAMTFTGCGKDEESGNVSETQTEGITESTTETEDSQVTETQEESETPAPSEEPEESEAPVPSEEPEESEAPAPSEEPEESEAPVPSEEPEESEEPESSEEPEPSKPTEAPIVQKNGTVDEAFYNKAVAAFETIVKKMRADGLVKATDVCVEMDNTSVKVDITFHNSSKDLSLVKDTATNVYTLTFDYGFIWLPDFTDKINGIDPAPYNKELLIAILSMVSDCPKVVFDRIDLDSFSAAGLYVDKWTEVADCALMGGPMEVDKYISYYITTEEVGERDASYTLQGAGISCEINYKSSLVKIETVENKAYLSAVNEEAYEAFGYPEIKTGCTSIEDYKNKLLASLKGKGFADASITEYGSHTVNGYTYHWIECFYKSETEIGDPDIIYVQIGENTYVEIYNIWFQPRLETFINECFYIKEVK